MRTLIFSSFVCFGLLAAPALGGCAKTDPAAQAEETARLIIGNWAQSRPVVTEAEGTKIQLSEAENSYRADGTFTAQATMRLSNPQIPPAMDSYYFDAKGQWSLSGETLTETVTDIRVRPKSQMPEAAQLASVLRGQIQSIPQTTSTITKITGTSLTVRDDMSGMKVSFTRQP